jgi:hypothetical protein
MSYRAYFCEVSENRTGEPLSVAALMLQHERLADRAGSGTIGGFMLRRGQTTTFQERLDITERAAAGQSDPEIAAALGCSVWTVRKWRRRGQQQGRTGLNSQMGRPPTGPMSTLPAGMRETILHLGRAHPGWGPTTLLAELRVDPRWADHPLPSRSRIAALLKAEKLTRGYQKLSPLPTPAIQLQGRPHDEWELDAQGRMHVAGVGNVSLITIIDVVSRWQQSRAIPVLIRLIPPCQRTNSCYDVPS